MFLNEKNGMLLLLYARNLELSKNGGKEWFISPSFSFSEKKEHFSLSFPFSPFTLRNQPQDEDQAHDHVFRGAPLLELRVELRGQRGFLGGELGLELPLALLELLEPQGARGRERGLEVLLGWKRGQVRVEGEKEEERRREGLREPSASFDEKREKSSRQQLFFSAACAFVPLPPFRPFFSIETNQ